MRKIGGGPPDDADPHGLVNYPYRQSRLRYHSGYFSQPYFLQARRLMQIIKYFRYFSVLWKILSRPPLFDNLFYALTACFRKGSCLAGVVFGRFFNTDGLPYNQQLFFESVAIFAHQQMDCDHQPVMNRKGGIHGQGYFL